MRDLVEDLEKTLQKAVDDLEELIDYYHACTYCAHNLLGYSCKLALKYGEGTCSAKWRGKEY